MTLPLAHRIAEHLPGWHVATEHDGAVIYLARADGARIVIPAWRLKGRVSFVGCWPRYADGSNYCATRDRFEITCVETKTPEAMAREQESWVDLGGKVGTAKGFDGSFVVDANAAGHWLLEAAARTGMGSKTAFGFGCVRVSAVTP
jgi:hypothetical protein